MVNGLSLLVAILLSLFASVGINMLFYRWLGKNWVAFLLSIPAGIPIVFVVINLSFLLITNLPEGLGGIPVVITLALIIVVLSALFYLLGTAVTSLVRWIVIFVKKKKVKVKRKS